MSIKLNDAQLLLLSGASQRADRFVVVPTGAKRRQALPAASHLLEAGYLKELRAKGEAPIWRRDEKSGLSYSLKLTAAGAKAIVVEESPAPEDAHSDTTNEEGQHEAPAPVARNDEPHSRAAVDSEVMVSLTSGASVPRNGTKTANIIQLLERPGGATLEELIAVTGWLPHTTRAALTGLRKRGYTVALDRTDKRRGSVYHVGCTQILGDDAALANELMVGKAPGAVPDATASKRAGQEA